MLKNIMGKNKTAAEGFAKVRDMERNSLQQIDALEKHRAELMQQQIEGRLKAEEEGRAFGGDVLEKLFRVESELTAERQYCNALCQRKIEQIKAIKQEEAAARTKKHAKLKEEVGVLEEKLKGLHAQVKAVEKDHLSKYEEALSMSMRLDPEGICGVFQGTLQEIRALIDSDALIAASRTDWLKTCDEMQKEAKQRFGTVECRAMVNIDENGNVESYQVQKADTLS